MAIELKVISVDLASTEGVRTQVFEGSEVSIGRGADNDLVLNRFEVSPKHALIQLKEADGAPQLTIRDLESANGVSVEHAPISPRQDVPIGAGERILIGSYLIKAKVLSAEAAAELPEADDSVRIPNARRAAEESDESVQEFDTVVFESSGDEQDSEPLFSPGAPEASFDQVIDVDAGDSLFDSQESDADSAISSELLEEISSATVQADRDRDGLFRVSTTAAAAAEPDETRLDLPAAPHDREGVDFILLSDGAPEPGSEPEELEAPTELLRELEAPDGSTDLRTTGLVLIKGGARSDCTAGADESSLIFTEAEESAPAEAASATKCALHDSEGAADGFAAESIAEAEPLPCLRAKSEDSHEHNFTAVRLYCLSGTVLRGGCPQPDVSIDAGELGTAVTDSAGRFYFPDIVEGTTYAVTVEKDGFSFSTPDAEGTVGGDVSLEFSAIALYSISGVITYSGAPLEGVTIDGGTLGTVVTDADGTYIFSDVPENTRFSLKPSKPGYDFPNWSFGTDQAERAVGA